MQRDTIFNRRASCICIYGNHEENEEMFLPLKMFSFIHSDYKDITFVNGCHFGWGSWRGHFVQ